MRGVFGDVRVIITMHLQALLCSSHMTETIATRVEELLTGKDGAERTEREGEEESEKFTFKLSLQMISWPHLGRAKEVIIALLPARPFYRNFCHGGDDGRGSHFSSLCRYVS